MNKKITLITLALAFISWTTFAQTISTTDTLHTAVPAGSTDVVGHGTVDNTFNQVKTYRWTRNTISITEGWESAICDKNLCYLPHIDSQEFMATPLEAGARLDVHVYPGGNDVGSAFVEVTITDVNNENNSAVGYYLFDSGLTSTQNASQTFFKVFPKLLKNFQYNNLSAEWYDIAELPEGSYMLQLIGNDNEILGSKLITKL